MTTLTATPNPAAGSVLLQVASAPNPPANAYADNGFATTDDGWTGPGGTLVLNGSEGAPAGKLQLINNAVGTQSFSRTVTGLTIGAVYRYSLQATRNIGQIAIGVSGIGSTAFLFPVVRSLMTYTFAATATSHVIQVSVKKSPGSTLNPNYLIDTVRVSPTTGWLGTTIRRTDVNGTSIVVREDSGGQDTSGGTMTVTDYEAALIGTVVYTVTDGNGSTATATTTLAEYRRNLCTNPNFETDVAGWAAYTHLAAPTRSTVSPYSGAARLDALGNNTGTNPRVFFAFAAGAFAVGDTVTMTARIRKDGTWPTGGTLYTSLRWALTAGGETIQTSPVTAYAPDASGWMRVDVTGTVPAGANGALQVNLGFIGLAANLTAAGGLSVDEVLIEKSATVGAYFDGSTANNGATQHYWFGTVNASASVESSPLARPAVWLTLPATAVPSVPTAPQSVQPAMVTDYTEASETGGTVHPIIARADKVTNPGPLRLRAGTFDLWCADYPTAAAVRDLLASGEVALLRQTDLIGFDMYLTATAVGIRPEAATEGAGTTRRVIAEVAYEEQLSP